MLPAGWTKQGSDPSFNGRFLHATWPKGSAEKDPDYQDGKGTDTVTYRIELPPDVDPARVSVRFGAMIDLRPAGAHAIGGRTPKGYVRGTH